MGTDMDEKTIWATGLDVDLEPVMIQVMDTGVGLGLDKVKNPRNGFGRVVRGILPEDEEGYGDGMGGGFGEGFGDGYNSGYGLSEGLGTGEAYGPPKEWIW